LEAGGGVKEANEGVYGGAGGLIYRWMRGSGEAAGSGVKQGGGGEGVGQEGGYSGDDERKADRVVDCLRIRNAISRTEKNGKESYLLPYGKPTKIERKGEPWMQKFYGEGEAAVLTPTGRPPASRFWKLATGGNQGINAPRPQTKESSSLQGGGKGEQ